MTLLDIAAMQRPAAASKRAFTLAVTSGKGGVGKTNLSVNLAALLAARQRSVILLDADMGMANADLLCGVKSRHNLAHVVAGVVKLTDILTPTPAGFTLIPGASGIAAMSALKTTQREELLAQLDELQDADILMFDTGAGIGRDVLSFTKHADHVLLVTTPEPTAMLDAYAVLKVLTREECHGTISMVVNQVKDVTEAQTVHRNIMGVAKKFLKTDVALSGYVVLDPCVPLAVRRREAFALKYPKSVATASLQVLAGTIDRLIASAAPTPHEGPTFFRRLMKWWA